MAFKLQFIDGEPTEKSLRMIRGSNFHNAASLFFQNLDVQKYKDYTLTELESEFSKQMRTNLKLTEPAAKRFAVYEARRYAFLRDEGRLDLYIPYAIEFEVYCEQLDIGGRVDRLDALPDKTLRLYEYKPVSFDEATMRLEFAFYLLLLGCAMPDKRISSTVVFEYETGDLKEVEVTPATVRNLSFWLQTMKEAVEKNWFPRKLSDQCVTCELLEICQPELETFESGGERYEDEAR